MRDRALRLVRFQALSLTPPLPSPALDNLRQHLLVIARAGVAAADAGPRVTAALGSEPLAQEKRVWLVAAGKAAGAMAHAAGAWLGARMRRGLVIAPDPVDVAPRMRLVVAEHPQPGEGSLTAGRAALDLAAAAAADDLLLVLLSGGASSLMAQPAPGLTLDDKRATTALLLRAGADIHELNTVRKHLSAIKGGRLAAATRAECLTLAISDVVGDDPSVIASGPTVADPSTYADALRVLERRGGLPAFPSTVVAHLTRGASGAIPETPKPGDDQLAHSRVDVIGGRRAAMDGAAQAARRLGYHVAIVDEPIVGEARAAARDHVARAVAVLGGLPRPACLVSGGETTVTVRGRGRGGRNQEFVLAGVEALASLGIDAALASIGTDGIDGPTDAAGAVADSGTLGRAEARGLAPGPFLEENDAYRFFTQLGDLIRTGPTGTNVGDLQVLLLA